MRGFPFPLCCPPLAALLLAVFAFSVSADSKSTPDRNPAPVAPSNLSTPSPTPCGSSITGLPRPANFSLYVLSMQWPFSVCLSEFSPPSEACHSPPASFTIRGLWPTNTKQGLSPRCCGADSFSLAPILDMAPALRRFWPDLSADSDDTAVWRAAWQEHGSCSGLALRTYFRKVLELSRRYDFLRALNAEGVVASAEKSHNFETIQYALNEATGGYRVAMRCSRNADEVFLDAVQVCLHKNGFATRDCPTSCLDGDVDCCLLGDKIRIPYWRLEYYSGTGNETWTGGTEESTDGGGFWVGQIAGIVVLGGGLAYWTFKQFFDSDSRNGRAPRPNPGSYQRITSSR